MITYSHFLKIKVGLYGKAYDTNVIFTKNNNIWLLSPASKDKNSAICLNNSKLNYCNVETPGLIYPTINLNSKVKVASGDGSSLEPYIVIFD